VCVYDVHTGIAVRRLSMKYRGASDIGVVGMTLQTT